MSTNIKGKVIRVAAEKGLTPYRIAKDCGLDEETVRRWMTGKGRILDDKLNLILPYLGLKVGRPKPKPTP